MGVIPFARCGPLVRDYMGLQSPLAKTARRGSSKITPCLLQDARRASQWILVTMWSHLTALFFGRLCCGKHVTIRPRDGAQRGR